MGLLAAVAEVAQFLEAQKTPYAVMGGLALQSWNEPRQTRDVDITVLVPPKECSSFIEAMLECFTPRIPNAKTFALQHRMVLVRVGEVPVDIS